MEPITRKEKQDSLTVSNINETARHMFLNHVPQSENGTLPHREEISKVVCAKASCSKDVSVQQFTLLVNSVVFATVDISLGSRCLKRGSRVCGVSQKCVRI